MKLSNAFCSIFGQMLKPVFHFLKEHQLFAKVFFLLLLLKTGIGFMSIRTDLYDRLIPVEFSFHKNYALSINIDDREMARTAWYKIHTGKYLSDLCFDRPSFRKDTLFLSAFRPRLNVLVHVAGLKIYTAMKRVSIESARQIPEDYFYAFGFVICVLKSVLFIISSFFFVALVLKIFDTRWTDAAALLFIAFPSMFMYIGIMDIFENVAMPLLVIFFSFCYVYLDENKSPRMFQNILYGLLISFACLIRPHILFILLLFLVAYACIWTVYFIKRRSVLVLSKTVATVLVILFLSLAPVLISNHKMFGSYVLSTQPQLEFFQGHNPYARGSWNPVLFEQHESDFKNMFAEHPLLASDNEKEELDFYYNQAKKAILKDPKREIMLSVKKTAIYLVPYNYLCHIFNPFNALVYAGTLGFLVMLFLKRIELGRENRALKLSIILAPVAGSYFLTLIFFVGERWRYYAEPFMIICALLFFKELFRMIAERRNRSTKKTPTVII
jgi:hypothetical protein